MPYLTCISCGEELTGLPTSDNCCDETVVRDIIETELKRRARSGELPFVPKGWLQLVLKRRISPTRLFNKAIECGCDTNDASKNLSGGSRYVLRLALRSLKDQFVVRQNGQIEVRMNCPDCGVKGGVPHREDCDIQRCSTCGGQYITCKCDDHVPTESLWLGVWAAEPLTERQIERQDLVDSTIHRCLEELAGKPIQWDISLIGAVRDVVGEEFRSRGVMNEKEFYPCFEAC